MRWGDKNTPTRPATEPEAVLKAYEERGVRKPFLDSICEAFLVRAISAEDEAQSQDGSFKARLEAEAAELRALCSIFSETRRKRLTEKERTVLEPIVRGLVIELYRFLHIV